MGKRVVIIASGETERRSLPHLTAHLKAEGISLVDVVIPPRHRALKADMVEQLILKTWFAPRDHIAPDKFVVLVDADGKDPDELLLPLKEAITRRLGPRITAAIQYAYAQWHLEAWYFADAKNLRKYLGRDLGKVDASQPDSIHNPKLHLKHILGDKAYTAVISEEIAMQLNAQFVAQKSDSFGGLLKAMRNGDHATPASSTSECHEELRE